MKTSELSWIDTLNEQTQWTNDLQASAWMQQLVRWRPSSSPAREPTSGELEFFLTLLTQIRNLVYQIHFCNSFDLGRETDATRMQDVDTAFLSHYLRNLTLSFDPNSSPSLSASLNLPELSESEYVTMLGTLILNFSSDLSRMIESGDGLFVHRCEGLFRDQKADQISTVSGVNNATEELWRKEIPLIVEQRLEQTPEIQRCADLFVTRSRSKYCSDACRFATFQIAKQLKDPQYLAEKQRRYRQKKSDENRS